MLMKPINRCSKGMQQIGFMPMRACFEEREKLAVEFGRGLVAELAQRRIRAIEVASPLQRCSLHSSDDQVERIEGSARSGPYGLLEKIDRVAKPIPVLRAKDRHGHHLAASLLQRQEAACEVSAVYRRHVAWKERLEALRVIPVE
jgi:hypothetical protein